MSRFNIYAFFFISILNGAGLYGASTCLSMSHSNKTFLQDTLHDNQVLYNGKIWRNLYFNVHGDQYLFTRDFLPGCVSVRGKIFTNILLKYDLYNDELLIPVNPGGVLQLNKEMVDSFSFIFQNKTYHFIRMQEDSIKRTNTYLNVLYKGSTELFLKYSKKIEKLADEGKYDKFYQVNQLYFIKNKVVFLISGKSDLMKALTEDKVLLENFIKINKLKVTEKTPESFIPLLRYYDSISK
jgi:hypothetical protein